MILESFLIFILNILYCKFFNIFFNSKNSRNFVAATHAFLVVLLNSIYFITDNYSICQLSYYISFGYFLFDLFYIILFESLNFLRALFIYHHIAAIYLIINNHLIYNTPQLFFLGELSNLPNYVIYYYLHQNNPSELEKNILYYTRIIQKIFYGTIRVIINSFVLYEMFTILDFNNPEIFRASFIVIPVYFMGIIWTIAMLLQ